MQDVSSAPARGSGRKKGGTRVVLFVALFTTRGGGTFQEGTARRLQWQGPGGGVIETKSRDFVGKIGMAGGDMFEIGVSPAVTGEQGMEMARQAMSGRA